MKNLIKISVLALAATALMVSCAKETNIEEQPAAKVVRTFTCTFAQPDTKVAITDAGKTTWEVGDEILVHAGKDGNERVTVTLTAADISADGKKATISVGELEPYDRTASGVKSGYYAQYPASAVASGILYYECAFSSTNEKLMAACNVDDTFVFFNLCGIISYKVSGDFDKLVFVGNNDETVGYDVYQARVRDDGDGATVNYYKPGNSYKSPTPAKSVTVSLDNDGDKVRYICLPNGANFSGGFTFKLYKNDELKKVAKTETAVNVAHGKILTLGDITAKLEDYVAPSVSDHKSAITDAEDISSKQSNCYIIDKAGAYKFPALKGNSDSEAGNVFDVQLVWETYNNAEEVVANSVIAAVDFEDNWIYFKTPDTLKPGNAVIAAKNSEGDIIWSWHIWIPASTIETSTYGDIFNKALMDRNLGALVAATTSSVPVESFGFHYEWGRKDPFVGALSVSDNHFANVSGTAISVGYQMTVAETIANPTKYAVYTEADSWGNWLTPYDSSLWSDDKKTMYDPCPAGYRVPKYDSSQPLHSSDLSAVTGWSDVAAAGDNAAYFTIGNPATVFPYCGLVCENGKYIDHLGARTFIWTAHGSSSSGSGTMIDVRFNTSTHKATSTVTSRGCSVRCVAE